MTTKSSEAAINWASREVAERRSRGRAGRVELQASRSCEFLVEVGIELTAFGGQNRLRANR